jgi:hypothetical protein
MKLKLWLVLSQIRKFGIVIEGFPEEIMFEASVVLVAPKNSYVEI